MKNKISSLMVVLLILAAYQSSGQDKENPFANGKPIGLVFTNFNTGINQGSNPTAFEIRRAYLGYQFDLGNQFSAKIQLDIGNPDDVSEYSLLKRFAYFKDAYLQYTTGRFKFRFGIIPLQQFKTQEKVWGHRYIAKSVIDEHKLGSSADLGASVYYKANDYLDFDLTMMNGEGYSKLQTDYSYKVGFGATLRPWRGLILRMYFDAINKGETQLLWVNFIGYEFGDKASVGAEYDIMYNNKFEKDQDKDVFSVFASYNLNKKIQFFGRYDRVDSNILDGDEHPWNLDKDGSAIIAGIQYKPISKVKISLNYQDWYPYEKNADNESFIYLNFEFKVW